MPTDLELALLLEQQYAGMEGVFDFAQRIDNVSFGVKRYPDYIVIAFEGSYCAPDWFSNFDAIMSHPAGLGGVEQGFYDGLPETLASLSPMLNGLKIYITGHSRGSAHAQIFAALLINAGYNVETVTFGAPKPGDATLAAIIDKFPCRWYRNYHDEENQDWVCTVPVHIDILAPYVHPGKEIRVDVAPLPNDPWGILAYHHIQLYIQGLQEIENGQ